MELTKEERDRRANVKMEEMKRKNEEYIKRFKEIEADKANADRMSSSVVVEPAKPYVMRARTPRAQPLSTSQAGASPPPLLASPLLAGPPPPPERGGPPPDPVYRFLSDPDRDGDDAGPSQQQQLTPPRSGNRGGEKQDRWRGGSCRGGGGNANRGGNWTTPPRGSGRGKDGRRGGRGRGNRGDRSFGGVDSSYDQRDESSPWQFNQSVDGAAADVGPLTPGSSGMWHNSGFNESLANMSTGYGCSEPRTPESSNRMGLPPSAGLSSTPNAMAFQSDITSEGLVHEGFKMSGDLANRLNSRDIRLEPQSTDDLNNQFQTSRDGGRGGGFNRSHVDWRQPQEDGINANYSATIDPNGNAGAPLTDSSDPKLSFTRNGHDSSWNRGGDGSGAYISMDGGPPRQGWGPDRGGGGHNRSWHEGRGGGRGGSGGRDSCGGRQDGRRGERGGGRKPGRGRGYDKWKAERDAIDEQRILRSRAGDGGWRRAWDNEKIEQGDRGDTEPVYDPRFPPNKSDGIQLGDFLAASSMLAPSLEQQQQQPPPPEAAPETYTQEPPKSPEYTPTDPSYPSASSTDARRGGAKSGLTKGTEIRGRGRKDRHANQVRAANTSSSLSASAGAAGQEPPPVAGYSGSWCVDASQEPVRDTCQEPITSEVLVDPKTQCVSAEIDANKSESKHSEDSGLNEIAKMVEQMVTQGRHKQDLKKYTQQSSQVDDIGAEGFGFGEDCLAAEWYDSSSRNEREVRRQAAEERREGGKSKRDLWVVKDGAPQSPSSSREGSPTDGPGQEQAAAPGLSFEELLQQHRSVQHEMYGTADEDDHRQSRRSSGKASRKDGRVTKRAVRRNKLGAAETILEDPTAADGTVTDMNKVSAALEALMVVTGSGATGSRPPLDGSWNEDQDEAGAATAEAAEMRNSKKNPALETLEEDFLTKLRDVDARADSLCSVAVATEQTSIEGAGAALNNMTKQTETRIHNTGISGVVDCKRPTPVVLETGLKDNISGSPKVFSTNEEIPPVSLVPLPDDDDLSPPDGSEDVVNDQDESSSKNVDDIAKPSDEATLSMLVVGPDASSGRSTDDSKKMQQSVGNQKTQSLASLPTTLAAGETSSPPSWKAAVADAGNKTTVNAPHTQQNGDTSTTPAPVASLSAFNSPSNTSFSTTPAQGGEVVSSEALNLNEGNTRTLPVSVRPSVPDTGDNGASDTVIEEDTRSKTPGLIPDETVAKGKFDEGGCDEESSIKRADEQTELGIKSEGSSCLNVVYVLASSDSDRTLGTDTLVQTNSDLEFNESNIVTWVDEHIICGAAMKGESPNIIDSSPSVSGHAASSATALPGDCDTTATAGKVSSRIKEDGTLSQNEITDPPKLEHLNSSCHDSNQVEEELEDTHEDKCQADSSTVVEVNLITLETSPNENHHEENQFEEVSQFKTTSGAVKKASESVSVKSTDDYVGKTIVSDYLRTADIASVEAAVLQTTTDNFFLETISDNACKKLTAENTAKETAIDIAVINTSPGNYVVKTATASVTVETVAESDSKIAVDELKTTSEVGLNLSTEVDSLKEADRIDVGILAADVSREVADSGLLLKYADAIRVEANDANMEPPLAVEQNAAYDDGNQITSIDDSSAEASGTGTIKDGDSSVAIESAVESSFVSVEAALDTASAGDLESAVEPTAPCVETAPHTTSASDFESAVELTTSCVGAAPDSTSAAKLESAVETTTSCDEAASDTTSAGDLEPAVETTAPCVEAASDTISAGDLEPAVETTAPCFEVASDTTSAGDLEPAVETIAPCVEAASDTTSAGNLESAVETTAPCVEAASDTTSADESDPNTDQAPSVQAAAPIEEAASIFEPAPVIVLDSKPSITSPNAAVSAKISSSTVHKTPLRSKSTMSQSGKLPPRTTATVPVKPTRSSSSASITGSTTSRTVYAATPSAKSGSLSKVGAAIGPAAVSSRTPSVAGKVSSKPLTVMGKTLLVGGRVSSTGVSAPLASHAAASSSKPALSSRPPAASKSVGAASDSSVPNRPTSSLRTTKSVASSESTTKSSLSSSSPCYVATSTPSTVKPTLKAPPSKPAPTSTIKSPPTAAARTPASGLSTKSKSAALAGATTTSAPAKAGLDKVTTKAPRPLAVKTAPKATSSSAKERAPVAKAATTPEKKGPAGT